MKFSEIEREQWEELRPYLDTCVLPITGMTGDELPFEATQQLENLRDILDLIEIPFKGRIVTYPACHYALEEPLFSAEVDRWCASMKKLDFKHVIIVTANESIQLSCKHADLIVCPESDGTLPVQEDISKLIRELWSGQAT